MYPFPDFWWRTERQHETQTRGLYFRILKSIGVTNLYVETKQWEIRRAVEGILFYCEQWLFASKRAVGTLVT